MSSAPPPAPSSSPHDQLGIAMIGHAFMGRAHSQAWRNVAGYFDVPNFRRTVLVGRDAGRAADAARRLGWESSSNDWRAVIRRDDVDIVDICAPGMMHAEIALAALRAGKHVLVEKPLANTLTEAEAMAAEANNAADRIAMVGFNYRRMPALALARSMIKAGRIGTPVQMRVAYFQDWLSDSGAEMSWRLRKEQAGSGALGDLGSHAVDQVRFLLGDDVASVSARTHTFTRRRPGPDGLEDVSVDDAAWATLELRGGAIASVEVSRVATGRKNALQVEVYGDSGSLRFDLERPNELWFHDDKLPIAEQGERRILVTEPEHPYVGAWWPQGHVLGWEHTFTHEVRDLLVAVRDGGPVAPTFADGLAVQRVLDAIETSSAKNSQTVEITSQGDEL